MAQERADKAKAAENEQKERLIIMQKELEEEKNRTWDIK